MSKKPFIDIRLKISDEAKKRLREGLNEEDGAAMLQGIDDAVTKGENYTRVWKAQGPGWKPLNPKYQRRKVRQGYSSEIWKRTGNTLQALSTPVKITTAGGTGHMRKVTVIKNKGGRVLARWTIQRPAAGGYFVRTNKLHNGAREFINRVLPDTLEKATENVKQVVVNALKRILGKAQ